MRKNFAYLSPVVLLVPRASPLRTPLCNGDLCVSLGDFWTPLGEIFRGVLGEICRVDMPAFLGDRLENLDQALGKKLQ